VGGLKGSFVEEFLRLGSFPQSAQRIVEAGFDCAEGHIQSLGDLLQTQFIREPQEQYFALAFRQCGNHPI
jgi:hypothetical protein